MNSAEVSHKIIKTKSLYIDKIKKHENISGASFMKLKYFDVEAYNYCFAASHKPGIIILQKIERKLYE